MTQEHLKRLTSIDASFLHQEDGGAHMHIGALAIFEGPPPTGREFRDHIGSRLPLVPRYRQKLAYPPLQAGRPLWADDEDFNLRYHVRHTALPKPGTTDQLLTLVSRVMSQRLDRTKPLWEIWLVEGLADDRFAVINKTHHAAVDGVGGIDILTALFDLTREVREVPSDNWVADRTPSGLGLILNGAEAAARMGIGTAAKGISQALNPRRAIANATHAVESLVEAARPFLDAAPKTPINVKPGSHRSVKIVSTPLATYKEIKAGLGGTVNDVVLTAVAGALGRFLSDRGMRTEGLTLRACVPVSVRPDDKASAMGNLISIMVAPLAVGVTDPVERFNVVHQAMRDLKSSKAATGAQLLTTMEDFLPPTVLAQASRLGFSSRLYNLLVTNVPGPQFPVYLMGRELVQLAPLAFLAPEHALAIAIVSYNGSVTFGLLADSDAIPDLDSLAKNLEVALDELLDAVRGA